MECLGSEEFAPDKSASATTWQSRLLYRRRRLAKECFGSNRNQKRTIATSRRDDDPTES
jgi:hypothetical protein